ncbi:glycosyltransferase family 2 protein [Maribacter sp. HTCC2170]|uniref:glycosyltransferase family 2 protein n=1 Tax=Maribacter sp. (strain HTCC2170 / KCCM 42371) TaxID=313603 RepID=UPI00006BD4E2|nr:glycosyltransferase family 2 protein [Maribacter sp. HTCC2170]EAR02159.1 glycosyltransferase [Maribacter sp. HTCC2170]
MNYYIVIPAHNEEAFLSKTLFSIEQQTLQPKAVVIVNDNSTDNTEKIIDDFANKNSVFKKLNSISSSEHLPGSKVINAFNKGFELLDHHYDFIVKLDADLILPVDYFEKIAAIFKKRPNVGLAGGFVYEKTPSGIWELNHPMNKKHVRGAFKAYSKKCFITIGGLKNRMGWDTVDELLVQFNGFKIETLDSLHVKHLRPTGKAYNPKAKLLQGEAMYTMDYGFLLTSVASLKMAIKQNKPIALYHNIKGFLHARRERLPKIVSKEEGRFIRKLRWKGIKNKLTP